MNNEVNNSVNEFNVFIERLKTEYLYDNLLDAMKKVYWIYNKRFGNTEYAKTLEILELSLQVEDCLNHFVCENTDICLLVKSVDENEHNMIIAAMIQYILED